jgi:hypothetical protein
MSGISVHAEQKGLHIHLSTVRAKNHFMFNDHAAIGKWVADRAAAATVKEDEDLVDVLARKLEEDRLRREEKGASA